MTERHANDVTTTLNGAINSSVTTITVNSAAPTELQSGNSRWRIDDEWILLTAGGSGTSWTVTRGIEGSTAASHADGATLSHVLTAASLPLLIDSTDTEANTPAAARAGRLFLPSDGLWVKRDTGSAWVPWGPLFPLADPALQTFAWVNQGTATVDATRGGIALTALPVSGDQVRLQKKATPSRPYTITAGFLVAAFYGQQQKLGLAWRQSSDGKLVTWGLYDSADILAVTKWSAVTTPVAHYSTITPQANGVGVLWLQVTEDTTNRICRWSADGQHWITFHTVGRTDYLTADEIGFYADNNGTVVSAVLTLLSWGES